MTKKLSKILYIEDEKDIREIAKISLEDIGGYTVKYCSSGAEAIEAAETFQPDLILLDVMMPNMDGPSTLKNLRNLKIIKYIPAIFMTAKVQDTEVMEYKNIGAIAVIAKPFDPMTLSEQIQNAWNKLYDQ